MGKNKIFYLCIFCLYFSLSGFNGNDIRYNVVKTALTEVGVRELTGKNDGKDVQKYLKTCNLPEGNPYCGCFVGYNLKCNGLKIPSCAAWSPCWFKDPKRNIYEQYGRKVKRTPRPGDVFGLYFHSKKRVAHVGHILEWNYSETECLTIEGNTNDFGSREGDGVYLKVRPKSQIYIISDHIDNIPLAYYETNHSIHAHLLPDYHSLPIAA